MPGEAGGVNRFWHRVALRDELNILFLSGWFPYPPDNGSRIRIYNLLKELAREHQITLLSFTRDKSRGGEASLKALRPYCHKVVTVPLRGFQRKSIRALLGFFSSRPRAVFDTYSADMETLVKKEVKTNDFDLIFASQIETAPYAAQIKSIPTVLEELELAVLRDQFTSQQSFIKKLRFGLTWWKHKRYVAQLLQQCDACTVVSANELQSIKEILTDQSQNLNCRYFLMMFVVKKIGLFQEFQENYLKPILIDP